MTINPYQNLSTKDDVKLTLAQMAGGAVGVGTGLLASLPLDARHQMKLVEAAKRLSREKEIAEKHWNVLLELQRGNTTLEELPLELRDFYRKKLAENADDLQRLTHDSKYLQQLKDQLQRGKLYPLFEGAEKSKMRGNFPFKVRHPASVVLPAALGLAGIVGGGYLASNRLLGKQEDGTSL